MQINPNSKRIDDQSSLLYQNKIKYIDAEFKLNDFKT